MLLSLAPADNASELATTTLASRSLSIYPLDTDRFPSALAATTMASPPTAAAAQGTKAPAAPAHHSNPSVKAKLFLDFNGHFEAHWDDKKNIRTPAYDFDGNPASFSSDERAAIDEIWARVAEDFAPFNIDVTTVDPGSNKHGVVAIIAIGGADSDWYHESAGGVALIDGFAYGGSGANVGFVFSQGFGDDPQGIADAASHEAGHLFGLLHQSLWNLDGLVDAYNPGNPFCAPIMGVSYYATRSTWSNGAPESSSSVIQDDMAIIASAENGFGYRTDDFGNSIQTAGTLPFTGTSASIKGVIGRTNDQDVWKFTTTDGRVDFELTGAPYGSNLDGELDLWDSNGKVVAHSNPLWDPNAPYTLGILELNARIKVTVAAGTYYLVARGSGDYGDVGQYAITGTFTSIVPAPEIDVSVDGVDLPNSGTLDFGNTTIGQPVTRTVTVTNSGTESLTLTPFPWTSLGDAITLVSNFGATSLDPGESTSFTLQLEAGSALDLTDASVQFVNNDLDEGTYTIQLQGHVGPQLQNPLRPGINVALDGVNIAGSSTINYGTTSPGVPLTKTFTVTNGGSDTLTLNPINPVLGNFPGFTLVSNLASTVLGPGESTDFSVRLDATAEAEVFGLAYLAGYTVSGAVEGFYLNVRGIVGQPNEPSGEQPTEQPVGQPTGQPIEVRFTDIKNDQAFVPSIVSVGDSGTVDFGKSTQGSLNERKFTVVNVSNAEASLRPLTDADMPSGFKLVSSFDDTSLVPGQEAFFIISLDVMPGERSGDIHIVCNDNVDDPYDILLTGVVFALAPDMELSFYGQSIADGGTLSFGDILQGDPAYANLTVTNQGTALLHLVPLNSAKMPKGFSLVTNISDTLLHPGESTLITVKINTAKIGPVNGDFQLKSNDGDHKVYDFTISANVKKPQGQIIDNGDAGNAFVGGNWKRYSGNGYAHDVQYTSGGGNYTFATYTFTNLPPGQYRVDATWTGNRKNASDAPYLLIDGQYTLAVVRVNQRVAPGPQTAAGRWQQLATVTVTGGQLVVELSNDANGLVIADAVRIVPVNTADSQPKVINPSNAATALASGSSLPISHPVAAAEIDSGLADQKGEQLSIITEKKASEQNTG
jgi:hypothetical protein